MRTFRDRPIKQKLIMTIMLTSGVGLLVSGAGIVTVDAYLFRGHLQRDLSVLVGIMADNSTAAVVFNDPKSAGETLAALRAKTNVVAACIYRSDGTQLASYLLPGAKSACPPATAGAAIQSTGAGLTFSQPIVLQERRIGTLVLLYKAGEVSQRLRLYSATVLAVLLMSSFIAFLLSSRLSAIVATPILKLAHAATSVSSTKDYSVRAEKMSGDELGVLVNAFNEMLAGIQSRDNELRKALLDREDALAEATKARKFLETTLASIGDAVISTDIEGRIAFANPVAQSLLGLKEADLAGKHLDDVFRIVNEFTRAAVESPVAKVLRQGAVVGMANHTILIGRDKAEVPIDDSGAPIRDESGTVYGTVLVFRDVSARRKAEATTRLLAAIVESSDDAIIGHDLNGLFSSWNKGAERIFGYAAEETIGHPTSLIANPESGDEMPGILARIGNGERFPQYQTTRRTKSGKVIDVAITLSPLYDEFGRIVGASKIARDITEQVRAADRLAQANAALQRSNADLARTNDDLERFAFVASHDLQEPLRMITVYSQLLIKAFPGQPSDDTRMFIEYIVGGTKRMRELLSDLLAYSEISGQPEGSTSAVDLNVVLEKVTENLKAYIDETGASITSEPLPVLKAYEAHLSPLFQNLIENAIKYRGTEPPRIHISVQALEDQFQFAVADNGIGIEPEYREKIFVPFKRLHGKDIPGTGIGLAICQRVVERYGGRIWVESEVGRGSTFIFTVPLSRKEH